MTTDPAADDAVRALSNALLSLIEQDVRPPCADGTDRWTDDDHTVRAQAAPHCDSCEIRGQCDAMADTARPRITHGIWAGKDYSAVARKGALA